MKWISIKDQPPPQEEILVYGKCGMMHVTMWDYDDHLIAEHCDNEGFHFPGTGIEFTHWMPLPSPPKMTINVEKIK